MEIKGIAKSIIERIIGRKIYKKLPFGISPLEDVINQFPVHQFSIVFDIGANIGQSAIPLSIFFPKGKIYCFEPVHNTFMLLKNNVRNYKSVDVFELGFGSTELKTRIALNRQSELNSLKGEINLESMNDVDSQMITLETLSNFCIANDIKNINYLKIDTEGFDLEVIKGGEAMLFKQSIDFIELEAGIDPNDHLHVRFEDIKAYLEEKNYFVFGIYEQVQDWVNRKPILRRVNVLFISRRMSSIH